MQFNVIGLDVNATSVCCPNSEYCVINKDYTPGCCAIGSSCGLPCGSSQYQCHSTTTISGKATSTAACCPRSCPGTSQYKCAASLGPGCCSFGYDCVKGGRCTSTVAPAQTSAGGCAVSQTRCADDVGGGCCSDGAECTVEGRNYYCAAATGTAVRTGRDGQVSDISTDGGKKGGLSTGAKAGIGGGVAGGALLIVVGVLYFCVRQRRNNRARTESSEAPPLSQKSESANAKPTPIRRQTADYFGPTATVGPYTETASSPGTSPGFNRGVPVSPQSPGDIAAPVEIDSRDNSNVTSPSAFSYKSPERKEYPFELP